MQDGRIVLVNERMDGWPGPGPHFRVQLWDTGEVLEGRFGPEDLELIRDD